MFHIALHDIRIFLVDRGNLIGLLIVPVVMTLVIGLVSGGVFDTGSVNIIVDILDNDKSEASQQFIETLRSVNSSLVLCPIDNDAEDICEINRVTTFDRDWAIERLADSISLATVEIPSEFGERVTARERIALIYLSKEDVTAPGYIQRAVDAALQRMNGAVVAARVGGKVVAGFEGISLEKSGRAAFEQGLFDRAATMWDANPISVDLQTTEQEERSSGQALQNGLGQSVPGMGSMFVMFTVFGGMTTLITDRKQWTLQRVASMPVSRAQLIGGKILARFSLGIIQYLVVFAVGIIVGMNFGRDLVAIVLIAIAFTLASTALSFALGSRLENEAQAAGLSLLLSLVFGALGGGWWPLEVVPEFMRIVAHITPVAWAMDGYNTLIFENGNLPAVLLPVTVLMGIAVAAFFVGIRRFKFT
jgi:ABC-2 type transport system permease protein